ASCIRHAQRLKPRLDLAILSSAAVQRDKAGVECRPIDAVELDLSQIDQSRLITCQGQCQRDFSAARQTDFALRRIATVENGDASGFGGISAIHGSIESKGQRVKKSKRQPSL